MTPSPLIERMLHAYYGDEFQGANAPNMQAAARVMLEAMRELTGENTTRIRAFLDAFSKENGLE